MRLFAHNRFVAVISAVLCLAASLTFASTVSWWHGLTQSQRNSNILSRAYTDNGHYVGVECKAWVQNVVYSASNSEVYPPQNSGCSRWYSSTYCYAEPAPYPANWCQPGQIIQMCWHNSNGTTMPHTAIVASRDSGGMYWIDCNWQGDDRVRVHYISYNQFNAAVGYNYTVYEIH